MTNFLRRHGFSARYVNLFQYEKEKLREYLAEDPDAVFVEDTAVLLGASAIITRPGTASRREEADSTARGLASEATTLLITAGSS